MECVNYYQLFSSYNHNINKTIIFTVNLFTTVHITFSVDLVGHNLSIVKDNIQ